MSLTQSQLLFKVLHRDRSREAIDRVQHLLQAHPGIAARINAQGRLPLHGAVCALPSHSVVAIVTSLLAAYPQAARTPVPSSGEYPLHIAAACQSGTQGAAVVEALLRAAPEVVSIGDRASGWTPLHFAARRQTDLTGIAMMQALLQAAPNMALKGDRRRKLPLHVAVERCAGGKPSMCLIRLLVEAAPEALCVADESGRLPLHYACEKASPELVRLLIQAAPQTARIARRDGNLPLHVVAAAPYSSVAVANLVLKAWPVAALRPNHRGWLPLHAAVDQGSTTALLVALMRAAPQTVLQVSSTGDAALHICGNVGYSQYGPSHRLAVLLRAAPQAIFICDDDNCWPRPMDDCYRNHYTRQKFLKNMCQAAAKLVSSNEFLFANKKKTCLTLGWSALLSFILLLKTGLCKL